MFYRGKHAAKSIRSFKMNKVTVMVASLVLLFTFVIGGTLAWLADTTEPVVNVFEPVEVKTEIQETVNNTEKTDIYFTNPGEIPVYIRATVAVYWTKGNDVVAKPSDGSVTFSALGAGWIQKGDIYYYNEPVEEAGSGTNATSVLFESIKAVVPEGYAVKIDIHAEAIQAEPITAVQQAWGFVPGA